MASSSVGLAIVGLGTVGTGVVKMLQQNHDTIRDRCGADLVLKAICERYPRRKRDVALPRGLLTTRIERVLDDPAIAIVVELVGDTAAAHEIVTQCLKRGKHVATANKSLLAEHWDELIALARRRRCGLRFEASVMSGVPVLRALNEGLAGNAVESILGVLNGTTNYILTRITRDDLDYDEALRRAQAGGFCEPDPAFDVEGADAAYKLSILASIALGRWLPPDRIPREGITHLQRRDVRYAERLFGYRPKLLAIFKRKRGGVEARVHPAFVPETHPLAAVLDEYNAVHITARPVGSVMLYGAGAGAMPAASGVVSDVIHLARAITGGVPGDVLTSARSKGPPASPLPIERIRSKYYLRFTTVDRPGVLARISGAFGREGVSIESVYQAASDPRTGADIVMTTHMAVEGAVRRACAQVARMRGIIRGGPVLIRIEEGTHAPGRD